jgi:hypothetical protein
MTHAFFQSTSYSEHIIAFTREDFAADPVTCLAPLVEAGLIYVENEWHVTLPVVENFLKAESGWFRAGV